MAYAQMRATRQVAVATCRAFPHLDGDGPLLLAALQEAGLQPHVQIWDDPDVDWSAYETVLVRSTWDYARRREAFLHWASRCRRTANPGPVLAWNTDKYYLQHLARAGVPVVPTVFGQPGEPIDLPRTWRTGDVVVKPAVGASAADTGRFAAAGEEWVDLVATLYEEQRAVMIQPYLSQIDVQGETSLLYLGGTFSHAVRKAALLMTTGVRSPLVGDDALSHITPATATTAQLAVAEAALAAVPGGPQALTYARVDLVPADDGRPVLLELELTEPSLFLRQAPKTRLQGLAGHLAAKADA